MYNDFVVVGPPADAAGVSGLRDVLAAFRRIHLSGATFVSRGDDSGTHKMEQRYWAELDIASGANPGRRAPSKRQFVF